MNKPKFALFDRVYLNSWNELTDAVTVAAVMAAATRCVGEEIVCNYSYSLYFGNADIATGCDTAEMSRKRMTKREDELETEEQYLTRLIAQQEKRIVDMEAETKAATRILQKLKKLRYGETPKQEDRQRVITESA